MKFAENRVKRLVFVWVATAAFVLASGCSKSGGNGPAQNPPAPNTAPAPTAGSSVPDPNGPKDENGNPIAAAPGTGQLGSGTSSQLPPTMPAQNGAGIGYGNGNGNGSGDDLPPILGQQPQAGFGSGDSNRHGPQGSQSNDPRGSHNNNDGPVSQQPKSHAGFGEVVLNPTGFTPDEIFSASEQLGPAHVGVASPLDQTFFSGSGQDFLREKLVTLVGAVKDPKQAELNRQLAHEIGLVTFDYNERARTARVSLSLADQGPKKAQSRYNFDGRLERRLELHAGSGVSKSGLLVDAVCMDVENECHTVHIKLSRATGKGIAVAHVIARQTTAYLYIAGNSVGATQNRNYDALMTILLSTVYRPNQPGGVEGLRYLTSEVINGASELAVVMQLGVRDPARSASSTQVLSITGLLVKPAGSSDVSEVLQTAPDSDREIAGTIGEARLLKNDGRGNLQLDLTVRKSSSAGSDDTIHLTVARIHHETRTELSLR